ncbi:DEAD-box helicase family protein [Medicago truncatula]|uniref:DEAD-box helicase family protein n=1 Tax=Medicago truncatula TaxID=3880 RepID=A0A072TND3_MEDTR|nr:DEAD-box helicase family protein [Medicago truncatula]
MVTIGGTSLKDDVMFLYQPVHLLVRTLGRILDLAKKGVCVIKDCSMLVMDEAYYEEGMGFRHIHGFNLAMLGKQSKYFSNGNFLGASLGHNPSYVWSSIWSSRILLKIGYWW